MQSREAGGCHLSSRNPAPSWQASNFRFVLDPNYTLTLAYDLRWAAPQETAYPSTFVIDRTGIVRYALVSKSHGGRSTAADVVAELRKIK